MKDWASYRKRMRRALARAGTCLLALVLVFAGLVLSPGVSPVEAASAILVPNADVTAQWTALGGSDDATCASGTHCDRVDETSLNAADYVSTGTTLGDGVIEEFGLTTRTNVANVTSVQISIAARSFTNANGTQLDTVGIALRVGGTLQAVTTVTPAYSTTTFSDYTATYNGNWTQTQLDGMQVYLIRNRVGTSGTATNNDDDVQVARVNVLINYTTTTTYEQGAYRWFTNIDSTDVGTALAATNTAASSAADAVRLRMAVHVATLAASPGDETFNLQYSPRGGDNSCDTAFSSETYVNVGSGGTTIAMYDNPSVADATAMTTNANDPTHSGHTLVRQNYREVALSPIYTAVPIGQDALFDWSIGLAAAAPGVYCFRMVTASGNFTTYSAVAQLTVTAPTLEQSGYRFFNNVDTTAVTTFLAEAAPGDMSYANATVGTSDGGTLYTGKSSSDAVVSKFNSSGVHGWTKQWGGALEDEGRAIATTSDGGFIVAGITESFGDAGGDVFIAKFDSSAALSWSRTWATANPDYLEDMIVSSTGHVVLTGWTYDAVVGSRVFVVRLDSTGALSWSRSWGGADEVGSAVVETSDGDFVITGRTNSGAGGMDMFLLRYSATGTYEWAYTWGDVYDEAGRAVIPDASGGVIAVGDSDSFSGGDRDIALVKVGSTGTLAWDQIWGSPADEYISGATSTSDGGIAVVGEAFPDAVVAKFDSSGVAQWATSIAFAGADLAGFNDVASLGTAGLSLAGYVDMGGIYNFITARMSPSGSISGCTACSILTGSPVTPTVTLGSLPNMNSNTSIGTTTQSVTSGDFSWTYADVYAASSSGQAIDVGTALAAVNTSATSPAPNTPFRLRTTLHVTTRALRSTTSLKLQVATRGGDNLCDASATGETYADVSTSSGVIRYYNNPVATDDLAIVANANDPTHSGHTKVLQNYQEANAFSPTAETPIGQDALWDFALVATSGTGSTYCLRVANNDGTVINTYSQIPSIFVALVPTFEQSGYHWYGNVNSTGMGTDLGTQNTGVTVPADGKAQLRMSLHVGTTSVSAGSDTFKLQYSARGADNSCDVSFANETYVDVATSSGALRFFDNPTPADGANLTMYTADPNHLGHSVQGASYEESNDFGIPFSIASGADSVWGFALSLTNAPASTTYCLRAVKSDGSLLNGGYSQIPQITTASNTAPASPTSLLQKTTGDVTIATGGWHTSRTVRFTGTVTDPDGGNVSLCVEAKLLGQAFDNTESCTSVTSGSTAVVDILLPADGEYHWQARAKDPINATSSWVAYNTANVNLRDVAVDTVDPTGGTVLDGSAGGIDAALNDGSVGDLSANWSGFADATSGVVNYDYSIGTTPGGTTVTNGWSDINLVTSIQRSGLALRTDVVYYFNIRATDGAGRQVIVSSNGQKVAPKLTFTASTSSVDFGVLESLNNYTGTASVTLTATTNSYGGYQVHARALDDMRSGTTNTIVPFVGGSYASPDTWGSGEVGFGYTSSDPLVGGVNKFQPGVTCPGGTAKVAPGCYAPFTTSAAGHLVAETTSAVTGTPDSWAFSMRLSASATQPAGVYSTSVILTATAIP